MPSASPSSLSSQSSAERAPQRSFLAFDYGTRRIGVASGNVLLGRAEPLRTLQERGDASFDVIARLIAEWQPDALVVGVPFHSDGAEHDNTRRARAFARRLLVRFKLPVHEVDERYSTTEALAAGARGAAADAAAAAIILEQFLRDLLHHGEQAHGPSR
jgi:putative Holliday junction resolvase